MKTSPKESTLAVGVGTDSYRRGGGSNLAAPVSDSVSQAICLPAGVSSDRRVARCIAGPAMNQIVSAKNTDWRFDSLEPYPFQGGRESHDRPEDDWNVANSDDYFTEVDFTADVELELGMLPPMEFTRLFVEMDGNPTVARLINKTRDGEDTTLRLKGGDTDGDSPPLSGTEKDQSVDENRMDLDTNESATPSTSVIGETSQPAGYFFRRPGPRGRTMSQSSTGTVRSQSSRITEISSAGEDDKNEEQRNSSDDPPPDKMNVLDTGPESTRKRKRKQPPQTTGLYVSRREAIRAANEEKERGLQLDRESLIRNLEGRELFKNAKIDLDKSIEDAAEKPNKDIAKEVYDNLMEVIRIAKTSSNLKGTFQKSLKLAAAATLGCMEVLRERAEKTMEAAQSDEIRSLRREVASLKNRLETEVECERRKVTMLMGEAEWYRKELQELRRVPPPVPSPALTSAEKGSGAIYKLRGRRNTNPTSPEDNMEVDGVEEEGREKVTLPPREEWPPARRPPLKGQCKILEDRAVDVNLKVVDKLGRIVIKTANKSNVQGKERNPIIKEDKEKPLVNSRQATPRSLADTIREIVAEELRRVFGAPSLTGRETKVLRAPSLVGRETDSRADHEVRPYTKGKIGNMVPATGGVGRQPKAAATRTPSKTAKPPVQAESWATIIGRKAKKALKLGDRNAASINHGEKAKSTPLKKSPVARRPPRTAAVQILSCGDTPYSDIMRMAKERVSLEDIGIPGIRPRRARTGAFLLEIPGGAEGNEKANVLADKLKEALADKPDVIITRPERMAELRVRDIEDSITQEEIIDCIAVEGGCNPRAITLGPFNTGPNGMRSVRIKCPLIAANRIAKNPKFKLGWTWLRMEILPSRALQCFRCLEFGHVRVECQNPTDRSEICYRCGDSGHKARDCQNKARCVICAERGKPADHRLGGKACNPPPLKKKGMKLVAKTPTKPSDKVRVDGETRGTVEPPLPPRENRPRVANPAGSEHNGDTHMEFECEDNSPPVETPAAAAHRNEAASTIQPMEEDEIPDIKLTEDEQPSNNGQ